MTAMSRVVIIGGGPGGYESALVAAQLGAEVTVVDTDGLGGSAVLTDCVPSKTLIATAELMTDMAEAAELGIESRDHQGDLVTTRSRSTWRGSTPGSSGWRPTSPATSRVGSSVTGCASSAAAVGWTARAPWSPSSSTAAPRR